MQEELDKREERIKFRTKVSPNTYTFEICEDCFKVNLILRNAF